MKYEYQIYVDGDPTPTSSVFSMHHVNVSHININPKALHKKLACLILSLFR